MEGVSVIICCYNSARRLPETLSHLARQQVVPGVAWEVILVDNASSDDTAGVAMKHQSTLSLRIVREDKKGLSSARRRGIAESKFDTLVFCDDDNWLDPNYVACAFDIMRDRSIGALGGVGSPAFETSEPSWFHYVRSYYALGEQKNNIVPKSGFRYLYGAGMVVSNAAITKLYASGFTNLTSGRLGNTLVSGEDTELTLALQQRGYRVEWSEKLKFRHFITKERLTLNYCSRLIIGVGYSSEMINRTHASLFTVMKTGLVLIIPFKRYGKLFEKWRVFLFEYGRYKFHITGQK